MAVDDGYTVALLHMNGSDASTTFTDESGKTWTAAGNAQIDTAQSKFGGASGLFDGTGDYITTPDSSDFDFGTGDFTIDFQMRLSSLPTSGNAFGIAYHSTDASNYMRLNFWGSGGFYSLHFQVYIAGVENSFSTNYVAWSTGVWYHCAIARYGNNGYIFRDGVQQSSDTFNVTYPNFTSSFYVGRDNIAGYEHNGWIDEFRISKGIARWTANFTPPTSAYAPASVGRVIWFS